MQLDIVHSESRVNQFQKKLLTYIDNKNKNKVRIEPSSVFVPHQLGSVELYHGKKGFSVRQDDKKYHIKKYFTDPIIRNVNKEQLKAFLKAGYLSLNQMDDGEFSLKAKMRLNGGGPIGAAIGVFLGKAAVSVIGHGAILVISGLTGPAAPYTFFALEACLAPVIESTSMAGAVAGGIALGVATGPV